MPDITGYCISRLFTTVMQQFVVFATFSYHRIRNFGRVVEAKNSVPLSMGTHKGRQSQWCNRLLTKGSRFCFERSQSKRSRGGLLDTRQRRSTRRCQAHKKGGLCPARRGLRASRRRVVEKRGHLLR